MRRNILFIMCDQLRWDYLSCYGHPGLETPNIDALAERGVRFSRAYCQAPLCGPSRASFYTGRYMSSHGVMANSDPTRLDEYTLGDYLRPLGYRSVLVGKADNRKDPQVLDAFGVDAGSEYARAAACGGFEPFMRHEGLYPDPILKPDLDYNAFLRQQGYRGENPWQAYAASSEDSLGNIYPGWRLRYSRYPARIAPEHSETAYATSRAIDFLDQQGGKPWCLHLSFIKPHWPLIAPAPYHNLYGVEDLVPVQKSDRERVNPHPVFEAFMRQEYSESYARDEVRECVVPVYMGLVREIDDQLGRLFDYMKAGDLFDDTLIVFTSDHGDYLGDHWLGEKDLLHEVSTRIPLIVVNPNPSADTTRGTVCDELVEAIDLLPTFVEFAGGHITRERLEGRSLLPLLRSAQAPAGWRRYAVSEIDYSDRGARVLLDLEPYDCRAVMLRDSRWKYIYHRRFRPQLFDLEQDPHEYDDLGEDPAHEPVLQRMQQGLVEWQRRLKSRVGRDYDDLHNMGPERDERLGIIIGRW